MKSTDIRFQVGGTLDVGRSIYVKRYEDSLFAKAANRHAAWINIYGCRTMGKSSLYARQLPAFESQGTHCIPIDIAAEVGKGPQTARDWMEALGAAMAARLNLNRDFLVRGLKSLPPTATAGQALERILVDGLLKQLKKPILLILDEYDYVRELDYFQDIAFALRHIQNLQARSVVSNRLSICLVGLEPLMRLGSKGGVDLPPFATAIEMSDFKRTPSTFAAIRQGFPDRHAPSDAVLDRVFDLSGGQPLVTMELLWHVAIRHCKTAEGVVKLAEELVAPSGQGKDLQLFEKIERDLKKEGDKAFVALQAYEGLLKGNRQAQTAPGIDLLLLHGLVRRRTHSSQLEVKGELFRRRFDEKWVVLISEKIFSSLSQYRGGVKSKGKRICVINTGGTIGMVERHKRVVAPRDADEFREYFKSLDSIAEVVEFINLFEPRDSINVFPHQWSTIARYIYNRRHDGFDGFVVAHGTDTMAYTASAVAFALGPQLRFPVVFTGAQTTPDVPYGDAHVNLYRACEVAKKEIPEVVICFGNFVYRAVRAQKKDDRRFDGFESPTYPPLVEITGEINVRRELLRSLPARKEDLQLRADFETSILIVPQFPGLEPEFFEHLLHDENGREPLRGVIVQTLGAGNVSSEPPYSFIPFVQRAFRQGIPVIVTSQYPPDPGTHTKYTPAEAPISAGAIHAGNMTQSAAVAKFRWVLASVHRHKNWRRMDPKQKKELVSKLMVGKPIVGEF